VSLIRVEHGTATVELESVGNTPQNPTSLPRYAPRDLADATCAALLAINTPQTTDLARRIYEVTGKW
jgi:hypothetical protein